MKRDARIASKALFTIVVHAEPRLLPLEKWYYNVVETIERWYLAEGNQGVSRAKKCLQAGWLAILGEEVPTLEFVKADKGVPLLAKGLVDRVKPLRKDRRLMSAVLSLVRVTDLWIGLPDEATIAQSLKVIEKSRLPWRARSIIDEFGDFVANLLCGAYDRYPLVKKLKEPMRLRKGETFHFTKTSQGPNGALSEHVHLDLVTLRNYYVKDGYLGRLKKTSLYEEVKLCWAKMQPYVNSSWKADITSLEGFSDEQLLKGKRTIQKHGKIIKTLPVAKLPGRVSLKFEKSGKVRLVAAPDWFTQYTLQPLGDWLFDVLSSIEPDCTFDQGSAIPKIIKWQNEGRTVYSFDQSSCTDLFPVDMQIELLARRFDRSLAESVKTVMTDREWELTLPKSKTTTKLRWAVGQPLGVYASWPLMAVTHHLLVQFSSWRSTSLKSTWKPFEDYVICGDDIVIGSKRVADNYLRLVRLLGMKINMSKSHISGGKTGVTPVSEFAKLTVWNGQLLYEIKPNQLRSAISNWRLAVPLLWELTDRDRWNMRFRGVSRIVDLFWPRYKRFLDFLLTVPHSLGGCGLRNDQPLLSKFCETIKEGSHIHPILYFLCKRVRSKLLRESVEVAQNDRTIPDWSNLDEAAIRLHPDFDRLSTENYYSSFRLKPAIPSLGELVSDVLEQGWRKVYLERLLGEVKPEPNLLFGEAKDRELRRIVDSWAEAITRSRKLSLPKMVTPEIPELTGEISNDLSHWLEAHATLQIDRIIDAINYIVAAHSGETVARV